MITNFHELYQRYAEDVYRFAYWLCGDAREAEDVTSETFVRALTATGELQAGTVKGYLLTIAKNLVFKKAVQNKRLVPLEPDLRETSAGPEAQVETALELAHVLGFFQTLPEIDCAALVLRLQDSLSYEEIASVLGISLTAAKVRVHRARIKLSVYRLQQEETHR